MRSTLDSPTQHLHYYTNPKFLFYSVQTLYMQVNHSNCNKQNTEVLVVVRTLGYK